MALSGVVEEASGLDIISFEPMDDNMLLPAYATHTVRSEEQHPSRSTEGESEG